MEWGGANGNLAACFLDRLKELDKEGTFYPGLQYILIDKFESVIDEARRNPDLLKHQDRVTLLCAGVESLESFEDGTIDRIICNEVWSDLPTKLLIRRGGEVMEEHIRPNVSETKLAEIADWSGFVQAFDKKDTQALYGNANITRWKPKPFLSAEPSRIFSKVSLKKCWFPSISELVPR
jgi:SAM-dependent MidA family methyltransferase